jgi:hypothetical protein
LSDKSAGKTLRCSVEGANLRRWNDPMKLKRHCVFVLFAAQTLWLSGCATSRLWEDGQFARYHEPAEQEKLELFYSPKKQDVLVQFNESREGSDRIHRRGYWVEPNQSRTRGRRKPEFVSVREAANLAPIPVFGLTEAGQPTQETLYAVVSTSGHSFTLYSGSKQLKSCDLPVYRDMSGRTKQVLLTPPAVVADATVVAGVVAIYCAQAFWPALNCLTR